MQKPKSAPFTSQLRMQKSSKRSHVSMSADGERQADYRARARQTKPPHGPAFKFWAGRATRAHPQLQVTTSHSYQVRPTFNPCLGGGMTCPPVTLQRQHHAVD